MRRMPLGIQSLRKIAEGGYVYADKTQHDFDVLNELPDEGIIIVIKTSKICCYI